MARLMISLLGRFHCEIEGIGAVGLEARKAQELLGYLALANSRMHHRDTLSGVIWGDRSDEQAKKGLRQALWLLQSTLDNYSNGTGKTNLLVDGEWIGFGPQADIWIDAVVLERTYSRYQSSSEAALGLEDSNQIREATALYQGDLLEGWYVDWCLHERERFQFMYLSLLDSLLGFYETHGDYERGVNCGMKILYHDNARESTHRRLMRLHYVTGHRTQALHQYATCVAALKEELGVEPANSTQRLYQQICSDAIDGEPRAICADPHIAAITATVAPNDFLQELIQVRQMLDMLERQVDHLIATMM